jgi:hypothetical protein
MPFADRILQLEDGALKDGEAIIENLPAKSFDSQPDQGKELAHS